MRPSQPTGTGVLVLAGSSGRIDEDRAGLLTRHGATALAIRWFGGPGQQPGPFDVPLELFGAAVDLLLGECDRLAILGTSFGAEAALVLSSRDPRIDATIALAPSSVVWGGWTGERWTSHWTEHGEPLAWVPFLDQWEPTETPPAYLDLYRSSLRAHPDRASAAGIAVEEIAGDVVLVAGADDRVWPSCEFAEQIAARRDRHGQATVLITDAEAGHRILLPGERVLSAGMSMQRGGSHTADRRLGTAAWPHIAAALGL